MEKMNARQKWTVHGFYWLTIFWCFLLKTLLPHYLLMLKLKWLFFYTVKEQRAWKACNFLNILGLKWIHHQEHNLGQDIIIIQFYVLKKLNIIRKDASYGRYFVTIVSHEKKVKEISFTKREVLPCLFKNAMFFCIFAKKKVNCYLKTIIGNPKFVRAKEKGVNKRQSICII